MGVITAIESQRSRRRRRSIFVDGEFAAGAHEDVVQALGLAVGQAFDAGRLAELLRTETARKAREKALRLISYRDRSKQEIRTRLRGSDFPEDIVEEVVEQLSQVGLLDDEKFSREWVKSRRAGRPMGRARLLRELRSKGVERPTIDKALEDIDEETEYELAHELAASRLEKTRRDDPAARRRLISFLGRRGFSWDTIDRVLNERRNEF